MSADAELLRRAAALVRERGKAARARGPFSVQGRCLCQDDEDFEDRCNHRHSSWQVRTEVAHDPRIISYQVTELNDEGDAWWLALLSPQAAEPLASWFEETAREVETSRECMASLGQYIHVSADDEAVALARVLLGETDTTP